MPDADGYMFWGNGTLSAPVTIPVTGTYLYDVWATGYPAAGQNPSANLYLDSTHYGTLSAGPGAQHDAFEWVLPAGGHTVAMTFTNDYASPSEDLNVALGNLDVCPIFESIGQVSYDASNTGSATHGAVAAPVSLLGGQTLTFGACGPGASYSGDTYLRLFDPRGVEVTFSDDACGAGSQLTYTAPTSGTYTVAMGCYSNSGCHGNMVWSLQ